MSRRPRLSEDDLTYRAQHALVPQAKMWSESPVPMFVSRPPRQAATPADAVTPPTYIDFWYWPTYFNRGNVGIDVSEWFWEENMEPSFGWLSPGDTCVLTATFYGHAITAPAGWTTLVSGEVDGLYYLACVNDNVQYNDTVVVGTNGYTLLDLGLGPSEGGVVLHGYTNVPAGYHVVASAAVETINQTSHDLARPNPAWLLSNTHALVNDTLFATYGFEDYMDGTGDQITWGTFACRVNGYPYTYQVNTFSNPGLALPDPCVLDTVDGNGPRSTDMVTFALGFSQ